LFRKGKHIVVGYEGFTYNVEPWSKNNMQLAFGEDAFEFMKDVPITCAGVIAGDVKSMQDLFMQIVTLCTDIVYANQVPGGGGPDQSALNIILESPHWKPIVFHTEKILHAGTSIPGIRAGNGGIGQSYLLDPQILELYMDNFVLASAPELYEGQIINTGHQADKYIVIHQYDRIPEWCDILKNKYKE
jgi:hypothetical protein